VKRATCCVSESDLLALVSIHARVKRATITRPAILVLLNVSIHARVKRATRTVRKPGQGSDCFNPRPREAGDFTGGKNFEKIRCFNPRPREAGDTPLDSVLTPRGVSIHARVKRATSFHRQTFAGRKVSIHARVKRAT